MIFPIQNGQLPQGFCPGDYQSLLNAFSAAQSVNISLLNNLVVSSTPPSDHTVAWLQLDSSGRPVRIYFFALGAWLSPHPLPTGFAMIWNLPLPDFTVFDGGDANSPPYSTISGQMWQLMASTTNGLDAAGKKPTDPGYSNPAVLVAQFPLGVGTFPSGTAVAVTNTGGEEKHQLVLAEMPSAQGNMGSAGAKVWTREVGLGTTQLLSNQSTNDDGLRVIPQGTDTPHNTVPPYYGVYFLQRTNRQFYVV